MAASTGFKGVDIVCNELVFGQWGGWCDSRDGREDGGAGVERDITVRISYSTQKDYSY